MRNMRQLAKRLPLSTLLFVAVATLLFTSCGKGGGGGGGDVQPQGEAFLTCNMNGQPYSFNHGVNANSKPQGDVVHFVVISGWENEDIVKSPGFGIDMVLPEGATEGTYTVAGGSEPELDGQYCIQNYVNGQHTGTTCYMGGRSDGTSFTLTITSLTDWGVKGTFSGVLKSHDDEVITVTDGKFSAPYN